MKHSIIQITISIDESGKYVVQMDNTTGLRAFKTTDESVARSAIDNYIRHNLETCGDPNKQIAIESKTFNEGDIVRFRTLKELNKLYPGDYRPPAFNEDILKKLEGKVFVVKSCERKTFHYRSVELYNHPYKLSDLSKVPCFIKDCEIYSWMLEGWKNEY